MNVSFPCHVCPTRTPTVLQPKGACLARAQGAPRTWLESSPRLCHACQNPGFATPAIGVRTPGFVAAAVLCHVRKLCKVLLQSQVRAPEVELQRHDPGRHENEQGESLEASGPSGYRCTCVEESSRMTSEMKPETFPEKASPK